MSVRDQAVVPTIGSIMMSDGKLVSMPPENMYPYLSKEELSKEMVDGNTLL